MDDPILYQRFYKYLDLSDGIKPTVSLGLIKNAPQSAIDAYEEFKKAEIAAAESGDE